MRNIKINFSDSQTRNAFTAIEGHEEFGNLLYDVAVGKHAGTAEQAEKTIHNVFNEILGLPENPKKQEVRNAIRRHKLDLFEVTETILPQLIIGGWGDNPFFRDFVEIKSMADGETNSFYVPDDSILTVGQVSGNHHDIFRQRLGAGSSFSIKTSWYAVKVYAEYELFLTGREDWATLVSKIYEAFDKKVNDMVYTAVLGAGAQVTPVAQFNKTGTLVLNTLLTLVEDVQAANPDAEIVIMGTKAALAQLNALAPTDWISDSMKEERHTLGRQAIWEGTRLVEIPQVFARNDTSTKLVSNTMLMVMPVVSDNKFVKIYDEGEAQIKEVTDSATNLDMTIEYEYQQKMGVGVIIRRKFGTWS